MTIVFHERTLTIDGQSFRLAWPVLNAIEDGDRVFVLFDPDSYLLDSNYKRARRQGAPAVRNLVAFTKNGEQLWEAELPDQSDYYYRISSSRPLVANSFSSYLCEIDSNDGTITRKEFLK